MQRRMVWPSVMLFHLHGLTVLQLSKEDEAAVGKDDLEVRREDQDKINKFSRLHQREMLLEDDLKVKAVRLLTMPQSLP